MQNYSNSGNTDGANSNSAAIVHLIQRTPSVEVLIKVLRRKGYPTISEVT